MFDVGFSEIFVIGLVALIVLGPERLPKVARTAGHLLGRLQRYVTDVKADINREMQLEELRRLQSEVTDSARKIEDQVRSEFNAVHSSLNATTQQAMNELEATAQSVQTAAMTPSSSNPGPSPVAPPTPDTASTTSVASNASPVATPSVTPPHA